MTNCDTLPVSIVELSSLIPLNEPYAADRVEKTPIVPVKVPTVKFVKVPAGFAPDAVIYPESLTNCDTLPVSRVELSSLIPLNEPKVAVTVPTVIMVPIILPAVS